MIQSHSNNKILLIWVQNGNGRSNCVLAGVGIAQFHTDNSTSKWPCSWKGVVLGLDSKRILNWTFWRKKNIELSKTYYEIQPPNFCRNRKKKTLGWLGLELALHPYCLPVECPVPCTTTLPTRISVHWKFILIFSRIWTFHFFYFFLQLDICCEY